MTYGDLFKEVRQRVAAYKLYRSFYKRSEPLSAEYEDEYLDGAYRFLNSFAGKTAEDLENDDFLNYCAKVEDMDIKEYVGMLTAE